jgi:cyclopropane-fatty-acyl-phospholipid synthase
MRSLTDRTGAESRVAVRPAGPRVLRGVTSDEEARRAIEFLVRLLPARAFQVRLWDGSIIQATQPARLTVVIRAPGSLRRMFRAPFELSLGEAYLRGDFDLEGDVWAAGPALEATRQTARSPSELVDLARHWLALPQAHPSSPRTDASGYGTGPATNEAPQGSREWDREGIRYHYDAGNDFFALFLDRRMVYSCAYYPEGVTDLDTAQERKLDLVCRKLRIRPGERLLDIGCGWGGLAIHAADRFGARVLGVTLSDQQHALAAERVREAGLQDRVEIACTDYRDVGAESFDKVASVGMFEHVGRTRLLEYFQHVSRILRPGGLFLNHGIAGRLGDGAGAWRTLRRALEPRLIGGSTFRKRYVFPTGDLVPVSEANLFAERAGFEVRDVENLREHYMRTLRAWAIRLESRADEAVRAGGPGMFRLWRLYLGIASWQFEHGEFSVHQSLLEKPTGGPSSLPPSRADLYV